MNDGLQRSLSIGLGAAVIALFGWITVNQSDRRPRAEDAGAPAAIATDAAAPVASAAPKEDLDAGALSLGSLFFDAGMGAGTLPSGAPRSVKLGVVLVSYVGAEGASSSARNKKDALALAQKLAADAKTDWKATVKAGDSGSSEDIGRIPRGVLDPSTEVAVFSLGAGEVSGVLDTPRGYWIVKRAE